MARLVVDEREIISVDGPISIGKTTLGTLLCERLGDLGLFFPETGHKTSGDGENPIDIFLEDPVELGGQFQMAMYAQCQSRMLIAQKDMRIAELEKRLLLAVIDRSLIGNAVFAETNYRIRNMTDLGFRFYRANLVCEPTLSLSATGVNVQLWASVDTCLERLKVRALSDTTEEQNKYKDKVSYFWELARTAFCALLSNLSREEPHPQLVLNWETDAETSANNFCNIYNAYKRERTESAPLAVRLSHDSCPEDEEQQYVSVFNCSVFKSADEFFSRDNITEMMNVIALRDAYTGPRRFFVQLPRCVDRNTFSEIFPLTIL